MRTIMTWALLLIGSTFAIHAKKNVQSMTIKGTIEGIKSGCLYLLARSSENKTDTLGTTRFKAPHFTLKAEVEEPIVAQLVVEGYSGGFTLMAEPGAIYEAQLKNGEGAYIRGGNLHNEWSNFVKCSERWQREKRELKERIKQLHSENKYRSASVMNDSLRALEQRIGQKTKAFLDRHDDLIAAHTFLSDVLARGTGLEESIRIFGSLGEGARQTPSGRMMKERIDRLLKTTVGKSAPDFTLLTPTGREITLSKVKGKIKILDFWASWCGPCRLNNPSLRKAYETYHDKGLEIVSVSLDNEENRWTEAIQKDELPWINVSSLKGWNCPVARQYSITDVPAIFVLSENNHILATDLRGEKLMSFLEDHLNR